jgi:two-component system, NtrC family, sensor kinase
MKSFIKILFLLLIPVLAFAQEHLPDSNLRALKNASNDSMRYRASHEAYLYFEETNRDSALYYTEKCLSLSKKNNKQLATARALASKGYILTGKGQYAEALENLLQAFAIAQDTKNASKSWFTDNGWYAKRLLSPEQTRIFVLQLTHHMYGILMRATENIPQQIFHFKEARRLAELINSSPRVMLADMNLGEAYVLANKTDSALLFLSEAKEMTLRIGPRRYLGYIFMNLGVIALKKGDAAAAKNYYYEGIASAAEQKNHLSLTWLCLRLTDLYLREKQRDSSLYFAKKGFETFRTLGIYSGENVNIGTVYQKLYDSYSLLGQTDSAYKYAGLALSAKDTVTNIRIQNLAAFQKLSLKEQLRLQHLEKEKALYQSRLRTYALIAGLAVFLVIAGILYRNNRQKHKANEVLKSTLHDLKSTQTQLIQSEKMASLGELTAGIAHEIQNPLNFVNNFSEVSIELLEELKQEEASRNKEDVIAIADDLTQNLQKINHHGKRADAIVKGMLEHSRAGSGVKELTDINKLADEYLRLSYHGLRSKDKSFNADMVTHFDEKLPQINAIPRDIGRVLLNLFNNAFYAVNQKAKTAGANYKPEIFVSTSHENGKVTIVVKDNGTGIPDAIKDKIMQPFFTTKPTGEGTGLGLSLTYDMVVKGHGGSIQVNSVEGRGSEFIIQLPIN